MIHSFRLRLALLSALLSGVALAAFGFGAWLLIRSMSVERVDHEVRSHAEREVSRERTAEDWQRIEAKLVSAMGVRNERELLLLVEGRDGRTSYRSPHWPAALDAARLPWPVGSTEKTPRDPDRPPPRDPDRPPLREPDRGPPAATAVARTAGGHTWRIGLATTARGRVAVAVDAALIDAETRGARNALLVALPFALALVGCGAWLFSMRALRPLSTLTAAASRTTARGLDQRIPVQGEDREFAALIEVFNRMLERLERSFLQANRFAADAAHELKTPLAILQGQLERAMGMAEAGSPIQSELGSILDEVRRLSAISRKLLLLSRADAGRLNVLREPFDLSAALGELLDDIPMLAPQLRVTARIEPDLAVEADGTLLRQVLHNLIGNAIKYNLPEGWIRVAAGRSSRGVEVTVTNSSPGIPVAAHGRLFERFFRADAARSRNIEGVGLGLSLSREIVRAHGGDLTFTPGRDGDVQFTLRMPARQDRQA